MDIWHHLSGLQTMFVYFKAVEISTVRTATVGEMKMLAYVAGISSVQCRWCACSFGNHEQEVTQCWVPRACILLLWYQNRYPCCLILEVKFKMRYHENPNMDM